MDAQRSQPSEESTPFESAHRTALPERQDALCRWFTRYSRRFIAKHFHTFRVAHDGAPPTLSPGPAIFYCNHPSWWDPMAYFFASGSFYPDRRHYAPIEAAALEKYGVFRKLGVFGIEPDRAAGARRFLRVGEAILSYPNHALWVTAQGRFTDVRARPSRLRPGVSRLARRVRGVTLIPVALEYGFWEEKKPETFCRFGEPFRLDDGQGDDDAEGRGAVGGASDEGRRMAGEDAAHRRVEAALEATQDRLAEQVISRDPAAFEAVVRSRSGVGGVYDVARRLRAWVKGEAFESEHNLR